MKPQPKFIRIPNTANRVGIQRSDGHVIETLGAWPLIDENFEDGDIGIDWLKYRGER